MFAFSKQNMFFYRKILGENPLRLQFWLSAKFVCKLINIDLEVTGLIPVLVWELFYSHGQIMRF
jgi:hypothetical protein